MMNGLEDVCTESLFLRLKLSYWIVKTPKQHLVYHLLIYVVNLKNQLMIFMEQSEESMNGIFRNYRLKTMMLWSCEQHSPLWWSVSLVLIIRKLLHFLSWSFSYGELHHYFTTSYNLIDYLSDLDSSAVKFVISNLATIVDESLSGLLLPT